MIARLKEESRTHHSDADADRLAPLATPTSVAGYVSYLARILGFEEPVERALAGLPELALLVDRPFCDRASWIVRDLQALGLDAQRIAALPRCAAATLSVTTVADALGWLYVVERNAPLHGVVRRHLARRMPGQMAAAGRYLSRTELEAAERLRAIGAALDEIARTTSAADRIVSAVDTAFQLQRRWLRHLPMSQTTGSYRHL